MEESGTIDFDFFARLKIRKLCFCFKVAIQTSLSLFVNRVLRIHETVGSCLKVLFTILWFPPVFFFVYLYISNSVYTCFFHLMSEGFILAFAFILYHSGGTSSVEHWEVCIFYLLNYSAHNPLNWTYYFKMFWAYHYTLRFANLDASASAFSVHFASLKKQYKPNICKV